MLKFDIAIQRQVITANLDDFSPNAMLPNVHGGQYGMTPQKWRTDVISLTCGMLAAELIEPLPGMEAYHGKHFEKIREILQHGDAENGFDVDLTWNVIHFYGTKKLHDLLEKLQLDSWEAIHDELSPSLGNILAEMHVVYF
ncbi:hypothetical protein [Undibacterium sp. Ji49W]|uniref:hypothetical protein n=1 Tax=Undibacterium sp. Ji49W TaxID=3413040 RepID=UPI003BF38591